MSELPSGDPYLPRHGDPSWSARHYDLDLTYAVDGNRLSGTARIEAEALVDLDRVVLDLAGLKVDKLTVDGKAPARWTTRLHRLSISPRGRIRAGTRFTVAVRYSGHPRPLVVRHHGDAGWEELTDGVIVAGQPHGAPTWFPCNDRPDDKATYTISVATQPGYRVVSNGELVSSTRGGSTVTWRHEMPEPMATYLATVQLGRYEVVEHATSPVPVTSAVPAELVDDAGFAAAFGRQGEMLAAFAEHYGPYPFASYAAVVTADDLEIPLESQGLSTFGTNFCRDDWDSERLVAHELAHQWFGNAVTLARWRDIWLHEGFACFSEWLWSEASGRRTTAQWAAHHHERLAGQAQDLVLSDPGPELMFDDRVYKRGALTLQALRTTLGDQAFFDLLRGWVAEHSGGSVTTADFRAFAAESTGADLDALFDAWLDRSELPDLP